MKLFIAMTFFSMAAVAFDQSHGDWTEVLSKYQAESGLIRYQQLSSDIQSATHPFNRYLNEIQKVTSSEYDSWPESDKKAFLINSYNALTIKLILNHYPVSSIKKIGGLFTKPWNVEFFRLLDGKIKKLDPIEHEWLRPKFKDYRIHSAVNCASISCPPLRHEAYIGAKLDAQLDEQMRLWLKDPTRNQVTSTSLKLSKIFDWYKKDFDDWGGGIHNVIVKYLPTAPLRKDIGTSYLDYDWALNETK